MNRNRKSNRNMYVVQGADSRQNRRRQGFKMAGILLLSAYFLTLLGIYTVYLKFSIDCKYMKVDELKQQNYKLDIQTRKLEAEVESLKSYARVESVLREAGCDIATPQKPLYVSLDGSDTRLEKAELLAPRPEGHPY